MEVFAVPDLPEVEPGDDLARLVGERTALRPDDVVVVASTVVSKAAGRIAALDDFAAGPRAREVAARLERIADEPKDPRFAQAVLEEATEVLMEAPFLLTETRFGHVAVNAGIDRSNTGGGDLLLLPRRPDERAASIRAGLSGAVDGDTAASTAAPDGGPDAGGGADDRPAVVVSDTCGRAFRHGQTGVAIGWAGLPPTRDWRGERDREGRELEATVQAVVDELASAANLVAGEGAGGTPVVVVRDWSFGAPDGGDELFRDVRTDFVRQALREWTFDAGAWEAWPEPKGDRSGADP